MILQKTASAFLAAMLLSGMFLVTIAQPVQADIIGAEECFPAVLMLRGSGEKRIIKEGSNNVIYTKEMNGELVPFIETNGYEGEMLSKLTQHFTDQTNPVQTVSKTRFIGVDYEALDVFPDLETGAVTLENSVAIKSIRMAHHVIKYQDSTLREIKL